MARYSDPDTGKSRQASLPAEHSGTAEQREKWAAWKSRELAKRRLALDSGAPRATGTAVSDAVKRYFRAHPHLSPRSKLDYGAAGDKFMAWSSKVGVRTCDDLTRARLMAFREAVVCEPKSAAATGKGRGRGARIATSELRAPHSINGDLRKVRTILGYLRKVDLLPRVTNDDLKDGLQRLPVVTERIEFLKPRDCQRVLDAALRHDAEMFAETRDEHRGQRDRGTTHRYDSIAPFTAFVLMTGMRLNEAANLDWSQVDLDALDHDGTAAGEIYLIGGEVKTRYARTVVLDVSTHLRPMLAKMRLRTGGKGSVFGMTEGMIEAAARRMRITYGAPRFHWQMLRCTCGTYLTNAPGIFGAASAFRSAKQLGHSVTVAEKRYVGLLRGIPREARTLEAAMQIEPIMARVVASVSGARRSVEGADEAVG
jgi:integrase